MAQQRGPPFTLTKLVVSRYGPTFASEGRNSLRQGNPNPLLSGAMTRPILVG
jgi:hypothetical protein